MAGRYGCSVQERWLEEGTLLHCGVAGGGGGGGGGGGEVRRYARQVSLAPRACRGHRVEDSRLTARGYTNLDLVPYYANVAIYGLQG